MLKNSIGDKLIGLKVYFVCKLKLTFSSGNKEHNEILI
jgi:hypothetical protein